MVIVCENALNSEKVNVIAKHHVGLVILSTYKRFVT